MSAYATLEVARPISWDAMLMPKRQGNRPDRRIEPPDTVPEQDLHALADRIRYEGSAHHKLRPGDYGFSPPSNPRGSKSLCDDLRAILRNEATGLFRRGIEKGMISKRGDDGLPKYVWAVDDRGEAYEAKRGGTYPTDYHGYRLNDNDPQRAVVLDEWNRR